MPSSSHRRIQLSGLAGGLKTDRNATRIRDDQASRASNVEFSDDSARSARGSIKLNNQVATRPGVMTRIDPAYSPLYVEAGKSVPLRGYVVWPYSQATDIGGNFAASGSLPAQTYHLRRGRAFEINHSFTLPDNFVMGDRPARGEGAPNPGNAAIEAGGGYDEGLDDCTILVQKGGDRTTPMSWALGIVNAGNHAYHAGLGSALARKSNYFLVFMWLDAPEWGTADRTAMRYDLATGITTQTSYCTMALRAFILDGRNDTVAYALEPGKSYHVSLALKLDSLSNGVNWNHDGRIDFRVREENGRFWSGSFADSGGGGTTTNLTTWKGPTDSLRYFAKYGVRYSGRDAVHFGLGYRMAPWEALGWIPLGRDSAAMENKGFRLADTSLNSIADLYGALGYNLTSTHPVAGNTYLNVSRALVDNGGTVGPWGRSPTGPRLAAWQGLGGNVGAGTASDFNPQAVRGYRVVFPRSADGTMNALRGGRLTIESYSEPGSGDYRLEVQDAESLGVTWATPQPFLVEAFRWNQQDLIHQEFRLWSDGRDYSNPRVAWSLGRSIELDDETEPELEKLQAYLPMADGGGGVCRELVRGQSAFFAPFALPISEQGQEGEDAVFLSGEGEALVLDLSENPVFQREMRALLQSNSRGFAVEISCIIPEAHYGVALLDAAGPRPAEYEAGYCPDLVTVSVKDSEMTPLLVMGHHSWWSTAATAVPERRPQGFNVDIHAGLDSDNPVLTNAIRGDTLGGNWDEGAPWVGRRVTIQVGFQPSPDNRNGVANMGNEFRVYIAATPKGAFKYAAGEDARAEFAYWSDRIVQKKDLVRSVITIGGGWNLGRVRGYTEYSMRLVVDSVRVYGATASGELPSSSGAVTPDRRGKILGLNALPQRRLTAQDILQPLGVGVNTIAVTEGALVQSAPGNTSFFTQLPETTKDSIREKFLAVLSDSFEVREEGELSNFIQEFYGIDMVAADGRSLTLRTAYGGITSRDVGARAFNLIGYADFARSADDLRRMPLTLGAGIPYRPGVTSTDDLVLTDELFENVSPVDGEWKVRVASPFASGGLAFVVPKWARGPVSPRRNPVTGIHSLDSEILATARGAAFRVDDRWRDDGPTQALRRSIEIRGRPAPVTEQSSPLVGDGVRFATYTNAWPYDTAVSGFTWVYDCWVRIERYDGLQTILWLGCEYAHQLLLPAANDDQRGMGLWLRLNDGRPEVVRQSSNNTFGGSSPPPDGRYIGTASDRVPLGEWTHLRFWLDHYTDGVVLVRLPAISINGRRSAVQVNAQDSAGGPVGAWIQANVGGGPIGTSGDARNALLLGVARDALRSQRKSQFAAIDQLGGREFLGGRVAGRMHPLLGRLAGVVAWRAASLDASVAGFPAFNPYTFEYAGRLVRFRADLQEGAGHRALDAATEFLSAPTPGVIESHPWIDLYNELGASEDRPAFETDRHRVYVANGGRVAQITADAGGPAGILPPTTAPRFRVKRLPLWEPNFNTPGVTNGDQDPIAAATAGAGKQIYHYSSHGNNYLRQAYHEEMKWSKDDDAAGTPFDIFVLKFYWSPRSVSGVVPLYSSRRSRQSGGIHLECRNGKVRIGWFDTSLKEQVFVQSNVAIFRPGFYYYVYLRKAFPLQDMQEGNWFNSFWANGRRRHADFTLTGGTWAPGDIVRNGGSTKRGVVTKVYDGTIEYVLFSADADFVAAEAVNNGSGGTGTIDATPFQNTGDALVIREFDKSALSLPLRPYWSAKTGTRLSVSFTSEMPRSPNTSAIGQVTAAGILYSGTAGGVVNVGTILGVAAPVPVFTADMVGMQWQFSSTVASTPEKVYRISQVNTATSVNVVDENGVAPNLSAIVNRQGGVFFGLELEKSDEFDQSNSPDQAAYPIEFMGSELAKDPGSGISGHDGKFASFAWHVGSSMVSATEFYSGFNLFETPTAELSETGTDQFSFQNHSGSGRPGELHVDSTRAFTAVDTQPYAGATPESTQPNASLMVPLDPEARDNGEALRWRYLRDPESVEGRREVRVRFYDAGQDALSNPGPRLVVENVPEDAANPSGLTRLVLRALPISHQPGNVQRWIYVTKANDPILFRQAIVPDNVAGSVGIALDDASMDFSVPLRFDDSPPPDCSALALSQAVMFYGDVRLGGGREPSILRYSKPFQPTSVPFKNLVSLLGGKSERIVGMADLNGRLVVWKKDSMYLVTVREGAALVETISTNVGLAGPRAFAVIDEEVYWLSNDRGWYYYAGSGGPIWIGEDSGDRFEGSNEEWNVDPVLLARASMAVNRRQDQVVVALHAREERSMRRRLSIEYDSMLSGAPLGDINGFRHAAYEDPAVTALGVADRAVGGPQHFLGGTEDGFLVYLDRSDTQLAMQGADPVLWNVTQVTLGVGSTTSRLVLSAPVSGLVDLEGIRGQPVAWVAGGQEVRAVALFSDGSSIWLDRPVASAPASGTVVSIGALPWVWESKWFDLGNPEQKKEIHYLDLVLTPQASGTALLEVFRDFEATPAVFAPNGVVASSAVIDLSKPTSRIALGEIQCQHMKFRLRTQAPEAGQAIEVVTAVLRPQDVELH